MEHCLRPEVVAQSFLCATPVAGSDQNGDDAGSSSGSSDYGSDVEEISMDEAVDRVSRWSASASTLASTSAREPAPAPAPEPELSPASSSGAVKAARKKSLLCERHRHRAMYFVGLLLHPHDIHALQCASKSLACSDSLLSVLRALDRIANQSDKAEILSIMGFEENR